MDILHFALGKYDVQSCSVNWQLVPVMRNGDMFALGSGFSGFSGFPVLGFPGFPVFWAETSHKSSTVIKFHQNAAINFFFAGFKKYKKRFRKSSPSSVSTRAPATPYANGPVALEPPNLT